LGWVRGCGKMGREGLYIYRFVGDAGVERVRVYVRGLVLFVGGRCLGIRYGLWEAYMRHWGWWLFMLQDLRI